MPRENDLSWLLTSELKNANLNRRIPSHPRLIVMGMNYSYLAVEREASGFRMARYTCIKLRMGTRRQRNREHGCRVRQLS